MVDEEMDGVAHEQRKKLESIESELAEVKQWLDRLYRAIGRPTSTSRTSLRVSVSTVSASESFRTRRETWKPRSPNAG